MAEPVSKDNPRLLERVSDGALTRVVDQQELNELTMARGYRDVTPEAAEPEPQPAPTRAPARSTPSTSTATASPGTSGGEGSGSA